MSIDGVNEDQEVDPQQTSKWRRKQKDLWLVTTFLELGGEIGCGCLILFAGLLLVLLGSIAWIAEQIQR